jgi:acyl-CoA reductase-like NAD-dependent aldehyde dehydrogenase
MTDTYTREGTMNAATLDQPPEAFLADNEHFGRNFIGGKWLFPAAPFDFEVRNPADSTITTVVPLSSRFDVDRAVTAARNAGQGAWASVPERARYLRALTDSLEVNREPLARLQSRETGLAFDDSLAAVTATVAVARAVLRRPVADDRARSGGVTGHVLCWGLPLTEVVTSVLPALRRGDTAVVKPSLRGPLSAVAFARLAQEAGLPPGTVNIVQGTGTDVGAELLSRRDLAALHVRGGERTLKHARRAGPRTKVPLHLLHGGGNLCVAGPEAGAHAHAIAAVIAAGTRLHSGPFSLPLLAVHRDAADAILPAILACLAAAGPGPLPADPLRSRSLSRIDALVKAGATILLGGQVPDDAAHRMGWRLPATVLMLRGPDSPAARREQELPPLGPVLGVLTWTSWADLGKRLRVPRHASGTTVVWGASLPPAGTLPGAVILRAETGTWPAGEMLAPAWTGQAR